MITVELDNFSLKQICQSGQCFRMRETEENTYELIAGDQYLKLTQEGTIVTFHCSDVEFLCYWVPYFDIDADYVCYDVPNEFIVGFGLDYAENYRNLPYVGVLKEEIYSK